MTSIRIFTRGVVELAILLSMLGFSSESSKVEAAKENKKLPFDVCILLGDYRPRAAGYVYSTRERFLKAHGVLFNSVIEVSSFDEIGAYDLAVRISQPSTIVVQADVFSVSRKAIIYSFSAKGPAAGAKIVKNIHDEFAVGKPLFKQIIAEKKIREKGVESKALVSDNNAIANKAPSINTITEGRTDQVNDNLSDVDENIPATQKVNPLRFALIIGNEDYSSYQTDLNSEVNVAFASNDARTFKEYVKSVFGVPEENIIYIINARTVEMNRAISKINLYAKNTNGKAELIFYYAGHGLPDEETKESYLIPVDVSSSDLKFAVKLNDMYSKLTEYPTQRVTVFIDACFSGGARNQGLVAARGVKIKPKDEVLSGNLIVFTASGGEQSSLAYKDKQHGMFTYYLLKKLQESKGNLTYKELSYYISSQVGLKSVMVNNREQNPQVNASADVQKLWEQWGVNNP